MSRITQIDLCDYRAFPGPAVTEIQLGEEKRHLLLYGENGSGKSSLGRAFKDFFDTSSSAPTFATTRHAFTDAAFTRGLVTLHFSEGMPAPLTWSMIAGREGTHPLFAVLCATTAWLDYERLRVIYEADRSVIPFDIFPLCNEVLLVDVPMPPSVKRFGREWQSIQADFKKPRGRGRAARYHLNKLNDRVDQYNLAFNAFLPEWQTQANALLAGFVNQTELLLHFYPAAVGQTSGGKTTVFRPRISLRIRYRGYEPGNPVAFLNEGRLTACALSLWLAALLRSRPLFLGAGQEYPRVLVLDDVLLSLDMEHRRPLLDVLRNHFSQWQVFLLTHNRAWYDVAKQRLPANAWQFTELYAVRVGDYESPVVVEDEEHLYRALRYLEPNTAIGETVDVKAAAVHVRTKFELILKDACDELSVPVPFKLELKDLTLNTLWGCLGTHKLMLQHPPTVRQDSRGRQHIVPGKVEYRAVVPKLLAERISQALSWVLNPLSHSESVERYRIEIMDAVFALDDLERTVSAAKRKRALDTETARINLKLARTSLVQLLSMIPVKLQRLLLLKPLSTTP